MGFLFLNHRKVRPMNQKMPLKDVNSRFFLKKSKHRLKNALFVSLLSHVYGIMNLSEGTKECLRRIYEKIK